MIVSRDEAEARLRDDINLRNRQVAARNGSLYGLGLAVIVSSLTSLAFHDQFPWLIIPDFVAGVVLPGITSTVFGWMEEMRQKP